MKIIKRPGLFSPLFFFLRWNVDKKYTPNHRNWVWKERKFSASEGANPPQTPHVCTLGPNTLSFILPSVIVLAWCITNWENRYDKSKYLLEINWLTCNTVYKIVGKKYPPNRAHWIWKLKFFFQLLGGHIPLRHNLSTPLPFPFHLLGKKNNKEIDMIKQTFMPYWKQINSFCVACLSKERHIIGITLSPIVCCVLMLLWKRVNFWLYLPHALMDFNQSWVIDATWEPSFVDEVKSHISRSKVIWDWKYENGLIWKVEIQLHLNQTWFIDIIRKPSYAHTS